MGKKHDDAQLRLPEETLLRRAEEGETSDAVTFSPLSFLQIERGRGLRLGTGGQAPWPQPWLFACPSHLPLVPTRDQPPVICMAGLSYVCWATAHSLLWFWGLSVREQCLPGSCFSPRQVAGLDGWGQATSIISHQSA